MSLLEQWRKEEQATISVTDGETVEDYRFTFTTMSALQDAQHSALRQQSFALIDELFGPNWTTDPVKREEVNIYFSIFIKHAAIVAACKSVQTRQYADDASEEEIAATEWKTCDFPETWRDARQVAENIPAHTLNYLFETVILAGNPARLFGFGPISDDEKKMIRIPAALSENSPEPSPQPKRKQKAIVTTTNDL